MEVIAGKVPEHWRRSDINPSFKKRRKKQKLGNFRLIDFVSVPNSVLE